MPPHGTPGVSEIQILSKFRLSAHRLRIETGRHTKPKTLLEKRKCHTCNNLEDEFHDVSVKTGKPNNFYADKKADKTVSEVSKKMAIFDHLGN